MFGPYTSEHVVIQLRRPISAFPAYFGIQTSELNKDVQIEKKIEIRTDQKGLI